MRIDNSTAASLARLGATAPTQARPLAGGHTGTTASATPASRTAEPAPTRPALTMAPVSLQELASRPTNESGMIGELLAQWGQPGSGFDSSGDGTVDGADLGQMLAGMGAPTDPAANMAAFNEAWGTDDAQFDFNGDGTVDGADLGLMLGGGMDAPAMTQAPTMPGTLTTDAVAAPDGGAIDSRVSEISSRVANAVLAATDGDKDGYVSAEEAPHIARLLGGGEENSMISAKELAAEIQKRLEHAASSNPEADLDAMASRLYQALTGAQDSGADATALAKMREARAAFGLETASGPGAGRQGHLDALARSMTERMNEAGFEDAPPANLRDVVDGLGLGGSESQYLLKQLMTSFSSTGSVDRTA